MPIPLRIQDMDPSLARIIINIEQYITQYLYSFESKTLFVACSGGADSLSLLFILYYLKKRLSYNLHVLHCNHMLREEAAKEEKYVKNMSILLGLPCTTRSIDVAQFAKEHSIGIEEAGRICRYTFFQEIMDSFPNPLLCTGHHANDLVEDMLMRLLRGTSIDMLFAMPAFSEERKILRPLLYTPKTTLTTLLQGIGVEWCEDSTNFEMTHLRSRIRLSIIPLLMQENPQLLKSVTDLHTQTEWDLQYWLTILNDYNPLKISLKDLLSLHKACRMRLYRKACVQLDIQPTFDTLNAIDNAVVQKKQKHFILPNNIVAITTLNELIFSAKDQE